MVTTKLTAKYPLILLLATFIMAGMAASCSHNQHTDSLLAKADRLMEQHPDSSFAILKNIDHTQLATDKERARYALLMSMALDKNYIDTTSFDVIQPAIDYYLNKGKGTPDEKLRTYYYQGRIFDNKKDRDNALNCFTKALDNAQVINDSLCLARTLVAQAGLYHDFYDFETYTRNHLRAAKIYKKYSYDFYEFDCLLNVLNGAILLDNKSLADSVMNLCDTFDTIDEIQRQALYRQKLSYMSKLGTKEELAEILRNPNSATNNDTNLKLSLALACHKLGENLKAKHFLDSVYESGIEFDTLKYLAISVTVLRDLKDFEDAFYVDWDFSRRLESINMVKFEQKSKSIKEKHDLELKAQEDRRQRDKVVWGCIGLALLLCIVILTYSLYVKRLKFEHASDLLRIQNLQNNLFESDKRHENISNKIGNLFSTRFKLLDGLASSYFECKETGQEQKRIYAEVKNSIVDFSSDTTTQELIDIVNGYKNGLMDNFKTDYPKLPTSQYRLALYIFCGFSLSSISIFMDTDLRNIYVYKSRLKSIIAKGESTRKDEYLRYFA